MEFSNMNKLVLFVCFVQGVWKWKLHCTEDIPGKDSASINLVEEEVHFLTNFFSVCFPSDVLFWGDLWLICNLLWNTMCELIRIPSNLKWEP